VINDEIKNTISKLNIGDMEAKHITKIGEGAWHNVYKMNRRDEEDLVIRIRKKVSYGQVQKYNEIDLTTEYESSKVYYQQANQSSFKICPRFFDYYFDESLIFTVESFMGESKKLQSLNHLEAFAIGETLGDFFKDMHKITPSIKGYGDIIWNGKQLEGSIQQETNHIWQNDNDFYLTVLPALAASDLIFDRGRVIDKITHIINNRRKSPQKISLVNQDVTPENIIFNLEKTALIDPFPRLDFDLKYAGYFVFCYKFLLPAYSNTARYERHSYDKYSKIMSIIADGFIEGYINNEKTLHKRLLEEYILWVLLETYEHYETLNEGELDSKTL